MRNKIYKVISHPLISGSTINVAGSMTANVLNYIFNLAMGRFLSVGDYGTLSSLVSLYNILAVYSTTIITVFAKFTATFSAAGKDDQIGTLFRKGTVFVGKISILICVINILFAGIIAKFLNISDTYLVLIAMAALFFLFLSSIQWGILQGSLQFIPFSLINIFSSLVKLILGISLVIFGLKVVGGLLPFLLSTIIGYGIGFIAIRKFLKASDSKSFPIDNLHRELSFYTLPVFLSNLGLTVISSIDVILTKHFFNEVIAGQYAALSLMGRSIFYVVLPIISVFFSLIARKKANNENLFGTIILSGILVLIPSSILSFIYFNFPELVLRVFFPGNTYLSLVQYLGQYSIFIIFFSLAWLLNNYFLAVGKTRVFLFTVSASILEIILIFFFHSNISQIIFGLIFVSFLLLFSLLIYYIYSKK